MKLLLSTTLSLLTSIGICQSDWSLKDLNCLASPRPTEIVFSFDSVLERPVRIKIFQWHILDQLTKIDTLLPSGSGTYKVRLNVEVPRTIRIELDSTIDQIFVIPGLSTEIKLPVIPDGTHLTENEDLQNIERYYREKYNLLGIEREIQETFQFLSNFPDLDQAVQILDSLSHLQLELLESQGNKLPAWFVQYEMKNVQYTSLAYKLSVAFNLRNQNILTTNNERINSLIENLDSEDEAGLITPFYLGSLSTASMLQFCTPDCFTMEYDGVVARISTILKYMEGMQNAEIGNALSCRNLILNQLASRSLPDSIVQKFEMKITDQRYFNRVLKHKNPSIEGRDAPNFYLKDTNAIFHSFKEFQGQVVLLNFWFVGCRPCQEEIPFEKKLVEEMKDESFSLVNICVTSKEATWKNLIIREQLAGYNLFANENWTKKLEKEYNLEAYPRYVLINKLGKVVVEKCSRPSGSELLPLVRRILSE